MSARASRLRLEEELRRIVEQEETLDGEVKKLLQEGTADGAKPSLANGHHPPGVEKAAAAAASASASKAGRGGEHTTKHDAENGATAVVSAGGPGSAATGEEGGGPGEDKGKEGLAQCLAELSGSVPDFPGLEEKAGALLAQIEDGHGMAERVSRSVRRLDDIQMRVQRALALVEDVINLRGCAEGVRAAVQAGDLAEAATYVRRFREIDAGALADSDEMVDMDEAVKGLSSAVLERFETAVLDMDEPGIAATCPLLAPLGLATQGQELYLGFARRALEAQLDAEGGDESAPAMQRIPAIYNVSAAFLRRCAYIYAGGTADGNAEAAAEVLGRADALLEELAVLTQHTESYDRFVKFLVMEVESAHPSQEEVDSASPQGVDGDGKTVAGSNGGGISASRPSVLPAPILEPVMPARTRLQEAGAEVAVYYSQIEGQRDASAAFGGGGDGGGGGGAGHDAERVMSCLQGLGSTRALFSRAASDCLEEVLNRLRQVLRTVVSSHLGEKSAVSYQLSENHYAANEAEDPFAQALVEYLRHLLEPYRPPGGLTESLFLELLTLVAGYLAKRLEIALRRRLFTQLGGLQLDKDLRCIMGFFTQQAGRGAREPFSRLAQMSLLLNLERPQDAMDYWEPGSPLQAQLTADEVIGVLQQREDFAREDLASLALSESYKG
eukprot:g9273.t1